MVNSIHITSLYNMAVKMYRGKLPDRNVIGTQLQAEFKCTVMIII